MDSGLRLPAAMFFIPPNEQLAVTQDALQKVLTRCRKGFSFILDIIIQFLATNLISDFTPKGVRNEAITFGSIDRNLITCNTNHSNSARIRKIRSIKNALCDGCQLRAPISNMYTRDQRVGFTTTKGCLQSDILMEPWNRRIFGETHWKPSASSLL